MREGLGSHRNPTATQAKERAAQGDLNRGLHGGRRANYNRNARKGKDFVASGYRAEIMLPLMGAVKVNARSKGSPNAVLFPRYMSVVRPRAAPVAEGGAAERGASRGSAPSSGGQTHSVFNPYAK